MAHLVPALTRQQLNEGREMMHVLDVQADVQEALLYKPTINLTK